eukprot:TRINITY_DN50217_c0_g1_i1.p1 TRINITY_DN50217_c0_g1~~TRINITY_DN50217_c0_g1_i1.p1  ORF type:complete len:390 (+),score=48.96 TRINITY_DN50217_c0_g1_i1:132-1172(+)
MTGYPSLGSASHGPPPVTGYPGAPVPPGQPPPPGYYPHAAPVSWPVAVPLIGLPAAAPASLPSDDGDRPSRRGQGSGRRRSSSKDQGDGNELLHTQMKKTKLCQFFQEGRCTRGPNCTFAHGDDELRITPDLRKTRLCQNFLKGACKLDDCKFAHGDEELKNNDFCFKTTLCKWHETGQCQNGDACRFAHGSFELSLKQIPAIGNSSRCGSDDGSNSEGSSDAGPPTISKKRKAPPLGTEVVPAKVRAVHSRRQRQRMRRQLGKPQAMLQVKDRDQPGMLCAACWSTVATNLGMVACSLCRYMHFVEDVPATAAAPNPPLSQPALHQATDVVAPPQVPAQSSHVPQ